MLIPLHDQLADIIAYRHLLGGGEAFKAQEFHRRVGLRLNPENPEALATEAAAFVERFAPRPRGNSAAIKSQVGDRDRGAR